MQGWVRVNIESSGSGTEPVKQWSAQVGCDFLQRVTAETFFGAQV